MRIDYNPWVRVLKVVGPETYSLRVMLRKIGGWYDVKNIDEKRWYFRATLEQYNRLIERLGASVSELEITPQTLKWARDETARQELLHRGRDPKYVPPSVGWRFKTAPRGYQVAGSYFLADSDGCILGDGCGLGKTKMAIDAATNLFIECGKPHRVVGVICPNGARYQWAEEIEKHASVESDVRHYIDVLEGETGARKLKLDVIRRMPQPGISWVVVNYESVRLLIPHLGPLLERQIAVFDEAHRLKTWNTQVTVAVRKMRPEKLWLMTGTPVANTVVDLWSLTQLVRPGLLATTEAEFEKLYVKRSAQAGGKVVGVKNEDLLKRRLSQVMMSRRLLDCEDQIPPMVFQKRIVGLSQEERKAYNAMRDSLIAWFEEEVPEGQEPTMTQAKTFGERLIRLRQISGGLVSQGQDKAKAWSKHMTKARELREIWEDYGKQRMVVWCAYVDVLHQIEELNADAGIPTHIIHGGVPAKKRHEKITAWKKQDGAMLVCQVDTAGEALNLQDAALQVFFDVPYTPKQRFQAYHRLQRWGQTKTVIVIDLICRNTLDVPQLRALEWKMKTADELTEECFNQDRSLREQMIEILKGE